MNKADWDMIFGILRRVILMEGIGDSNARIGELQGEQMPSVRDLNDGLRSRDVTFDIRQSYRQTNYL